MLDDNPARLLSVSDIFVFSRRSVLTYLTSPLYGRLRYPCTDIDTFATTAGQSTSASYNNNNYCGDSVTGKQIKSFLFFSNNAYVGI